MAPVHMAGIDGDRKKCLKFAVDQLELWAGAGMLKAILGEVDRIRTKYDPGKTSISKPDPTNAFDVLSCLEEWLISEDQSREAYDRTVGAWLDVPFEKLQAINWILTRP